MLKSYYPEDDILAVNSSLRDMDVKSVINQEQLKALQTYVEFVTVERAKSIVGFKYTLKSLKVSNWFENVTYKIDPIEHELESLDSLGTYGKLVSSLYEQAIREVRYVIYIQDSGKYNEFKDREYPMLESSFKLFGVRKTEEYEINNFNKLGLALPNYYLSYYNSGMGARYKEQIYGVSLVKASECEITDQEFAIYNTNRCYFISEMRKAIITEYDEPRRLLLASRLIKYFKLYTGITGNERIDVMSMYNASRKEVYYIKAKNGDRIATINEKNQLVKGIYKKDMLFIPEEKRNLLAYFTWSVNGNYSIIKRLDTIKRTDELTSDTVWNYLEKSIEYLSSNEFLEHDILDLKKGLNSIRYPSSADDEVIDRACEDKIIKVYDVYKDLPKNTYNTMVCDIARKAIKYSATLSQKQLSVINSAYDKLIYQRDSLDRFNDELVENMQSLFDFYSYKKSSFHYRFLKDILKNKRCTEKQYKLIEQWLDQLKEDRSSFIKVETIDTSIMDFKDEADEADGKGTDIIDNEETIEDMLPEIDMNNLDW